jgi:hypothetical protein
VYYVIASTSTPGVSGKADQHYSNGNGGMLCIIFVFTMGAPI